MATAIEIVGVVAACIGIVDTVASEDSKRSLATRLATVATRLRSVDVTTFSRILLGVGSQVIIALVAGLISAATSAGVVYILLGDFGSARSRWVSFLMGFSIAMVVQVLLLFFARWVARRSIFVAVAGLGFLGVLFALTNLGARLAAFLPQEPWRGLPLAGYAFGSTLTNVLLLIIAGTLIGLLLAKLWSWLCRAAGWALIRVSRSPKGALAVGALVLLLVERLVKITFPP